MKTLRIISWAVTILFIIRFLQHFIHLLYSEQINKLPMGGIIGLLIGYSIVPVIFWVITYFVRKKRSLSKKLSSLVNPLILFYA